MKFQLMHKIVPVLFLVYIIIAGVLFSQTDSVYSFVLPELKITQLEKGKPVTYGFENEYNRFILAGNILKADTTLYKYDINVKDVLAVSVRTGTHFWSGAGIGAVVGFVIGFFLGGHFSFADTPSDMNVGGAIIGGLLVALPFGLIFGLMGSLSTTYEDYEFHNNDLSKRRIEILNALRKSGIRIKK